MAEALSQPFEHSCEQTRKDPLMATEKYFSRPAADCSRQQQQSPAGCMLAPDTTCRESDLRSWRQRNQEMPLFARVALRMEAHPARVFYVSEYVLHASSRFYEGLVDFYSRQPDAHAEQRTVTIDAGTLTDPRVLEACIFFMYTHVLFDVSGKDEESFTVGSFASPKLSFDVMELYILADFLDIPELTDLLQGLFFCKGTLFRQTQEQQLEETEDRVARMIIKCERLRSPLLLQSLGTSYAEGTGGLSCLCRWPTKYPRSTWDGLMRAGQGTSILWMAHVLPLYAIRFRLPPAEALQLLASLQLGEWVDGFRKSLPLRAVVKGVNPHFFKPWVSQMGTVCMNAYEVPELLSIQTLYGARFGVCLPGAYSCAMELEGLPCEESFMDWFVALTHVLAGTLQLLCCIRDKKVKAAVPPWLPRELEALFRRNYCPGSTAAWDPAEWDECFGLRSVAPDEHPCSIMNLEVKLAKEQLPPVADPATRERAQAAERYMRSLSQGVAMCLAARASSVRVTNARKRKSSAAAGGDEEAGSGSD